MYNFFTNGGRHEFRRPVEIVHRGEEFHRQLGKYYRSFSHQATNPRVKMALEFLMEHEAELEDNTRSFAHEVTHPHSDRWFKYSPNEELQKLMSSHPLTPDMPLEHLSECAHQYSTCITRYYKQFAETAVPEPLVEAFRNLLAMEEEAQKKMTSALPDQL